tara:strand:+ start:190 stop:327 length:138 start_codon:yes stop_codon:yes gene_type:complete
MLLIKAKIIPIISGNKLTIIEFEIKFKKNFLIVNSNKIEKIPIIE